MQEAGDLAGGLPREFLADHEQASQEASQSG
jgi:hypothetical protein